MNTPMWYGSIGLLRESSKRRRYLHQLGTLLTRTRLRLLALSGRRPRRRLRAHGRAGVSALPRFPIPAASSE